MEQPSILTQASPYFATLPARYCNRDFPYAPPQQKKQLQELLSEQRAQNKLARAFDERLGSWNMRSARDGLAHTIIDTTIETNMDTLNFVSTGLTKADFDTHEQGHVIHTRLYKGF